MWRPLRTLLVTWLLLSGAVTLPDRVGAQSAAPFVPAGLVEIERGSRDLDAIAAGFPSPDEAAQLMTAWGWAGNAYFNFAGVTASGTTSLEVSFHLFDGEPGATEAMSYFAAGRATVRGYDPLPFERVGDDALAIGGPVAGGTEVTIYLRIGAYLVRISAVSPSGDPYGDAAATARGVVRDLTGGGTTRPARTVDELLPTLDDMPVGFRVTEEGSRDADEVAQTFLRPGEASVRLDQLGFEANVYRYFAAPGDVLRARGSATTIEVSLHLFETSAGALEALDYYAEGRSESLGIEVVGAYDIGDGTVVLRGDLAADTGTESTAYLLLGNVLARISAMSPDGDPTADALAVAVAVAVLG